MRYSGTGDDMKENALSDRSIDFGARIVKLHRYLLQSKHESVLSKQILRSGTSIGANIHESKYAQSTADFIHKMQIALKECYESEYWLELLNRTHFIDDEKYSDLRNQCGSIRRMLIASINTTKSNL